MGSPLPAGPRRAAGRNHLQVWLTFGQSGKSGRSTAHLVGGVVADTRRARRTIWNNAGMSGSGNYLRLPAWLVGRWLLVGLVVAGVFGMHVLSAPDDGVGHGMVMTAQGVDADQAGAHGALSSSTRQMGGHVEVRSGQASASASARSNSFLPDTPPSMPGEMAMCLLFLATAAAAVAMVKRAVGRSDRAAGQHSATGLALGHSWRGPLRAASPRIALCILRV